MSRANSPLVTVIIPTYNSARFVCEAVESVLDQTWRQFEVIVVDDGSTDQTGLLLRRFGNSIQCLFQENRGPSAARNTGIKAARGEYVCFLDADDMWMPDKLEVQLNFLEKNPDIGLVFSDEEEISTGRGSRGSLLTKKTFYSNLVHQKPLQNAFGKLLIENFVLTSTVMARKACVVEVGLFDESLRVAEDRDLWLRIAAKYAIACLPRVVAMRREHENNISANSELNLSSRLRVWEKARCHFPALVPAQVLDALFADTHLQLAYIFAGRDERKEARRAVTESLRHAIRHAFMARSEYESLPRYRWFFAIGLLPLTFCGWSTARRLWRFAHSRYEL